MIEYVRYDALKNLESCRLRRGDCVDFDGPEQLQKMLGNETTVLEKYIQMCSHAFIHIRIFTFKHTHIKARTHKHQRTHTHTHNSNNNTHTHFMNDRGCRWIKPGGPGPWRFCLQRAIHKERAAGWPGGGRHWLTELLVAIGDSFYPIVLDEFIWPGATVCRVCCCHPAPATRVMRWWSLLF